MIASGVVSGQNAGTYGAGLSFAEPQTEQAFRAVAQELEQCKAPIYHTIGTTPITVDMNPHRLNA